MCIFSGDVNKKMYMHMVKLRRVILRGRELIMGLNVGSSERVNI